MLKTNEEETARLRSIIRYYTECFRSDNREIYLSDFLGSKVQQRYFFDGREELINGKLPYVPIGNELGEKLRMQAFLEQKEKQLVHASCFLLYLSRTAQGKPKANLAPLILHPASVITEGEHYYVSINAEQRAINQDIFRYLPDVNGEELAAAVMQAIGTEVLNFENLGNLARAIRKLDNTLNADPLLLYPDLVAEKALRSMVLAFAKKKDPEAVFINASALGLIQKSKRAAGILHELDEIEAIGEFSAPLRKLFGFSGEGKSDEVGFNVTPTLLNTAQETVIEQANKNALSVVIGPPGTGKSFTIAALAVNQMSQGKSVLVAAHTETAVNVLAEKVEDQLGLSNILIRGGDHQQQQELKKQVEYTLSRMYKPEVLSNDAFVALTKEVQDCQESLTTLESGFKTLVGKEIKLAELLLDEKWIKRFFYGSHKRYLVHRSQYQIPIWEFVRIYQEVLQKYLKVTRKYIQERYQRDLYRTVKEHRSELRLFLRGLRARLHSDRIKYFARSGRDVALRAFPIWFTTTSYVDRILPLETEFFDLLIIDEATQCSVSEVLPLLQRARRAVIVGDPRQLRFISFLSFAKEKALQQAHGVGGFRYRDFSILDLAEEHITDYRAVNFLNEHFRSVPPIINFSNAQFYHQSLEVLSSRPERNYLHALKLEQCHGRHDKGCNEGEIKHILESVKALIAEEKELPKTVASSIGLLSPFRAQADALLEAVQKEVTYTAIKRHRILVGTAHAFQGEERDCMWISMSVDGQTHHTSYRFINRADVFNVMVTRAKERQFVCYSFEPKQLPDEALIKAYLLGNHQERAFNQSDFEKDEFATDVGNALEEQGHTYWPLYKLGSLDVDLLARFENRLLAIDLIGYPGELQGAFSCNRYKMLNRIGITVFPMPYSHWQANKEQCMQAISVFLNEKAAKGPGSRS